MILSTLCPSKDSLLRVADNVSKNLPRDKFPFEKLSLAAFALNVVLNPVKSEILDTSLDVGLVF